MCTITFIPQADGYAVAMNRDERRTRIAAFAPAIRYLKECRVLSPSEPGGGTWVAVNEKGATFGLVNWYAVRDRVQEDVLSRGIVVAAASGLTNAESVTRQLSELPLTRINPFRFVGIFHECRGVVEWLWDLTELRWVRWAWETRQWISSGLDEPAAQKARSETFRRASKESDAGSFDWLQRLHRSHAHGPGPLSICMHRPEAASVSYTEVCVSSGQARMRYLPGNPCQAQAAHESLLLLNTTTRSNNTELVQASEGKEDHVNRLVTSW